MKITVPSGCLIRRPIQRLTTAPVWIGANQIVFYRFQRCVWLLI